MLLIVVRIPQFFIIMSDFRGKPLGINVKPPPFTLELLISFIIISDLFFAAFPIAMHCIVLWWCFPELPILRLSCF